jgi:Xaa-Pro dipeptidase
VTATSAAEHRGRVLAAMGAVGVDALVLGREANARYVSGAERLWLAGTRAFAPGCVLVAATGAVHLLSITDDGVPSDVPPEHLFPIAWNPMTILGNVGAISGMAAARRVGVDGMTPLFEQLLGMTFPSAELVDGEALVREVRRIKTHDDLRGIRAAVNAAEAALGGVIAALHPGVTERELGAAYEDAMTAAGLTAPAFSARCTVAGASAHVFPTDQPVQRGDQVFVRAGVIRDGWEGVIARTLVCGEGSPTGSHHLGEAVAACRAGARVGEIRATGVAIEGTGLGHEELDDDDRLADDMVVAVEVDADGILDGAVLHVQGDHPEVLTA